MTIELHIKIEPDFVPINLCIETARYLLAIAGIKPQAETEEVEVPKVELDVDGQPWDYRIHSSSKMKTADGKWKMKRNVNEKLVTKVTEDNKAAIEASAPAPIVTPTPIVDLFPDFMKIATGKISNGKLNHFALLKMLQDKGIPDIPSVKIRQDLIPMLIKEIEAL